MPLHKVTCVPRGHALGVVCVKILQSLMDYANLCARYQDLPTS